MDNYNRRRFEDIYNDLGDSEDTGKDRLVDFDERQFLEEEEDDQDALDDQDQQQLSQRLSQISTQESTTIVVDEVDRSKRPASQGEQGTQKRMKTTTASPDVDEPIPQYLAPSNPLFDKYLNSTKIEYDHDLLRRLACVMHRIGIYGLSIKLWQSYYDSGTGAMNKTTHRHCTFHEWPQAVQSAMEKEKVNLTNDEAQDQEIYVNYVVSRLETFRKKLKMNDDKLRQMKQNIPSHVRDRINEVVEKYVDQNGIELLKLSTECLIAEVEYHYEKRCNQNVFNGQRPTSYQQLLFRDLVNKKYEREHSKFEVLLLKQRLVHRRLPKSLESIELPMPDNWLALIDNSNQRQLVKERHKKLIEHTRTATLTLHIQIAEIKMNEKQMTFDRSMNQMRENQATRPDQEILDEHMLETMEERFRLIFQYLQRLFQLKMNFFDKAPTAMN